MLEVKLYVNRNNVKDLEFVYLCLFCFVKLFVIVLVFGFISFYCFVWMKLDFLVDIVDERLVMVGWLLVFIVYYWIFCFCICLIRVGKIKYDNVDEDIIINIVNLFFLYNIGICVI